MGTGRLARAYVKQHYPMLRSKQYVRKASWTGEQDGEPRPRQRLIDTIGLETSYGHVAYFMGLPGAPRGMALKHSPADCSSIKHPSSCGKKSNNQQSVTPPKSRRLAPPDLVANTSNLAQPSPRQRSLKEPPGLNSPSRTSAILGSEGPEANRRNRRMQW